MSARDYLVVQGGPGAGKSTAVVHLVKALAAGKLWCFHNVSAPARTPTPTQAMSARDYLVVQGVPGAGKSTAVVHLVKALAAGKLWCFHNVSAPARTPTPTQAMSARDYLVVQGGPGAGKSTAVVHLVKALAAGGRSVLVAAHTNTAVDHILLKLMKKGVAVLRVGRPAAVHPNLLPYTLNDRVYLDLLPCTNRPSPLVPRPSSRSLSPRSHRASLFPCRFSSCLHSSPGGGMDVGSVAGMEAVGLGASVVGCTCLGVGQSLFARKRFDVAILDEAGQTTLPVSGVVVGSVCSRRVFARWICLLAESVCSLDLFARGECASSMGRPREQASWVCLGVGQSLFARKRFDVAIPDEAGQTTLPEALGPLRLASTFVLLGDLHQLPPLVRDPRARQQGLGVSLLQRLAEAHPAAVAHLSTQYRMCRPVMALANALVYDGRLKCGSEAVSNARLVLPKLGSLLGMGKGGLPLWLQQSSLSCSSPPFVSFPLHLFSFSSLSPSAAEVEGIQETREKESTCNEGEAAIIARIVASLVAAGLPACDIGVATVYNAQVKAQRAALARVLGRGGGCREEWGEDKEGGIKRGVKGGLQEGVREANGGMEGGVEGGWDGEVEVEVDTVDRFQGRDKACVVFSTVRCNRRGQLGPVLADASRCNVAITRAKAKLLIIGSSSTLRRGSAHFLRLLQLVDRDNQLYELPSHALTDCTTAGQPTTGI
ncbi:unnamed protein product [Closterium sp. Yama58-4]|nr:unnamed protein product [Closterium sp. Yama58-4]